MNELWPNPVPQFPADARSLLPVYRPAGCRQQRNSR